MKITWDKSNEIGIKAIDQQHEYFFAIVNKIFALNKKKKISKEDLLTLVYELAGYATFHFSAEEKYCAKVGYPGTKAQIKAHQKYQSEIFSLMQKMQNPRTNLDRLAEEIANFTVDWLTHHILSEDMRFGQWNQKRKLKA